LFVDFKATIVYPSGGKKLLKQKCPNFLIRRPGECCILFNCMYK
jgi:hypothetical protein